MVYSVNQSEPLEISQSRFHGLEAFLSLQMVYDCILAIYAQKRQIRMVYPVNQSEPLAITQSNPSSQGHLCRIKG